ncbi:MAG: hypothetical protein GY941_19550 [Planctomycetes bacterium]|nr:hypothetical protein [Planctomycetota bacterium]
MYEYSVGTAQNIDTNDIETLVDNSDNYDADIIVTTKSSTTSSTSSTTKSTTQKKATKSTLSSTKSTTAKKETTLESNTLQPFHGEDCCSAVSLLSYDDISCDSGE